jgi:DNA-binding NtrC family response regulator
MAQLVVVDDDQDLTELLVEALRPLGHDVRVGHDGVEGLRLVADRRPDLLLADVEMPHLSGPEMVAMMRLHDLGDENVPVVIVSGIVGLDRVAAQVGTPYFLRKPYTLDRLLLLVERALVERTPPGQPGLEAS